MANVLPIKERNFLRRNYQLRVLIVGTLIMTIAVAIGILAMVPAYIFAQTQYKEFSMERTVQIKIRNTNKGGATLREMRKTNVLIQAVKETQTPRMSTAIQYILRDWSSTAPDIVISSFIFNPQNGALQLRISGEARTRASLNTFVNILQTDSRFSHVVFPVSDLANNTKIDFSVTMQFK